MFTHGRTDIKQENLKEQMVKLTTPISGDSGKTWLDKEFDHVMNVKLPPDSLSTVACEDYNESKNRDMDNIPCKFMGRIFTINSNRHSFHNLFCPTCTYH